MSEDKKWTGFRDYNEARLYSLYQESLAAHRALGGLDWVTENFDRLSRKLLEQLIKQTRDNLADSLEKAAP